MFSGERFFTTKMAKVSNKANKSIKNEGVFKRLSDNRYAKFQYEIVETIEAGIELLGTEVKSIRNGNVNLRDGYCSFRNGAVSYTHLTLPTNREV